MAEKKKTEMKKGVGAMNIDSSTEKSGDILADILKCQERCAADNRLTEDERNACVEGCKYRLGATKHFVQNQLDQVTSQFAGCVMDCTEGDDEGTKPPKSLEECTKECAGEYASLLPAFNERVQKLLKKENEGLEYKPKK